MNNPFHQDLLTSPDCLHNSYTDSSHTSQTTGSTLSHIASIGLRHLAPVIGTALFLRLTLLHFRRGTEYSKHLLQWIPRHTGYTPRAASPRRPDLLSGWIQGGRNEKKINLSGVSPVFGIGDGALPVSTEGIVCAAESLTVYVSLFSSPLYSKSKWLVMFFYCTCGGLVLTGKIYFVYSVYIVSGIDHSP